MHCCPVLCSLPCLHVCQRSPQAVSPVLISMLSIHPSGTNVFFLVDSAFNAFTVYPSSPCPTLEKSNKTANDTLINHQQQSSLQDEANKTNSRDVDTGFSRSKNKRPLDNHQTCSQNPVDTRQITRMRTSRNQYKQPNTHPEHVQLSQQPLMKNPPSRSSHAQTVTQTHDLSLWSAEPTSGSERQPVKKSTKPRLKKHTPTSQKELARLDSSDLSQMLQGLVYTPLMESVLVC